MASTEPDGREYRALLTDREREILTGEADVSDDYRYRVVSRVRDKIDELQEDLALLEDHHDTLGEELRDAICDTAGSDRELLEEAARELWGDHWSITERHFADGTTDTYAMHSKGRTDNGNLEQLRLRVDDEGRVGMTRTIFDPRETVEEEVVEHPVDG